MKDERRTKKELIAELAQLRRRVIELEDLESERKRVEVQFRESEEKYRSMMEAMSDQVYICSPDLTVEYMNPAMIQRIGRDASGEPCHKVIHELDERCPWCVHDKIQQGKHAETEIVSPKDGLVYHVSHSPIFHEDGSISKMTIFTDITEQKRAEDKLRHSEERYRDLYENAPIAYFSVSAADGTVIRCNSAVEQLLGYGKKTITGMKVLDFYADTPEGKTKAKKAFESFRRGQSARDIELEMKHKNGRPVWINLCVEPIRDRNGNVVESRSMVIDISERREAEEALKKARDTLEQRVKERTAELQSLSSRLLDVQEDERKRIAGDLHDGIGQSLSAIKFSVESMLARLGEDSEPSIPNMLTSLVPMLGDAIEDVRKTVMNLRPSILDDLGILSTISWFFRQFQAVYSDIRIEQHIEMEETEAPDALKITIFRVLQEAMNNIAKHSKAVHVHVVLGKKDESIELVITDNGCGFDLRSAAKLEDTETGFGITSMKERTELSGGSFSIESKKGAGTAVRATWPGKGL